MRKLISMIDYVLWLRRMTTTELINEFPHEFHLPTAGNSISSNSNKILANDAILWMKVGEYAKFLKQELKPGMFVPCDNEGKVLHKPAYHKAKALSSNFKRMFEAEDKAYRAAEKKVLFKNVIYDQKVIEINKQMITVFPNINGEFKPLQYKTIEDLVIFNLELTDSIKF